MQLDPSVALGSQYYINSDETPDEVRAGIAQMAQARLKLVRVFVQWTHVERQAGDWDWSQYDALFEAAQAHGLGVVATLMAVHPPGWMKLSSGPQDIGPLEDARFWSQALDYARRVVRRYGQHPALHSWILWNEPSRVLPRNEQTLAQFREFLRARYQDDVARLNERAYQQLSGFSEAGFPRADGGFSGYVEQLDWRRLTIHSLMRYLGELRDTIRAAGDTHPIHLNPHDMAHDRSLDGQSIWAEGRLADFMGGSVHPSWHSTRFPPGRAHQSVALFADLIRGATQAPDKHFWVSELQGGTNIYSGLTYLGPSADDLRIWMWQAIGAGAKAVVYWCFNARRDGFEGGEWSLLDQQGRPSRRLAEVSRVAGLLEQHAALFAASRPPRASVALLYSEATWRLGQIEGRGRDPHNPRNADMGGDALAGAYLACADAGIDVDVLDEAAIQQGKALAYAALILPGCTALEDATLPGLAEYVERGGTLLADGLCGYKDQDGRVRSAATSPLADIFRASSADIEAAPEARPVTLDDARLPVWFLKIALEPRPDTEVLARFVEAEPRAALTLARVGRGRAIRLGTVFFQRYFGAPAPEAWTALSARLPLPESSLANPSPDLRLRRLALPDGELWVLVNAGQAAQARLRIPAGATLRDLSADQPWAGADLPGIYQAAMPEHAVRLFRMQRAQYGAPHTNTERE